MDSITYILMRGFHMVGIVIWVGGVFFVTFVLLPALKSYPESERFSIFERFEHRFAWYARISMLIVGVSGLLLADQISLWQRMKESHLWYIHLMLLVWLIFALILFVLEPLIVHRWLRNLAASRPQYAIRMKLGMHWFLSLLTLFTVLVGTMGAHGWAFL